MSISKKLTREPLTEEYVDKNLKVRVTCWLDNDVVKALRTRADKEKSKYQTLMNKLLRESLLSEESVEKRLQRLEAKVFRK